MLSVIVTSLNAERTLPRVLSALVPGVMAGLVREVILADRGSHDRTLAIADDAGGEVATGKDIASAIAAAVAQAKGPWLMLLGARAVLSRGWESEVEDFIAGGTTRAATFRLMLDGDGIGARLGEHCINTRARLLKSPVAAQGLIVPKRLFGRAPRPRVLHATVTLLERPDAQALTSVEKIAGPQTTRARS